MKHCLHTLLFSALARTTQTSLIVEVCKQCDKFRNRFWGSTVSILTNQRQLLIMQDQGVFDICHLRRGSLNQ